MTSWKTFDKIEWDEFSEADWDGFLSDLPVQFLVDAIAIYQSVVQQTIYQPESTGLISE